MRKNLIALITGLAFGICLLPATGLATVVPTARAPLPHSDLPVLNVRVLGKDSRTAVPIQYRGLMGSMGLLHKSNSKKSCSAFCVAPDVIATAAHCVLSGKKGKKRPELSSIYFYKIDSRRRLLGRRSSAIGENDLVPRNMFSGARFYRKFKSSIGSFKYDWSLLKLRSPICGVHTLVVRSASRKTLRKASKAGRIFQIAFHGDRGRMRSLFYSRPCRLRLGSGSSSVPKVLKHDCDTANGSSGSPILMETLTGPVVIGINVGSIITQKVLRRNGRIIKRFRKKSVINTAVNARLFEGKIEKLARATIYFGTVKLVALQILLKKKKFYKSKADGIYGSGTRAAIMAYQHKSGLPVNGFPSVGLLSALSDGQELKALLISVQARVAKQKEKLGNEKRKAEQSHRLNVIANRRRALAENDRKRQNRIDKNRKLEMKRKN